ncbi:MAG: D-inositol-3-phosphate glycosyltransferase [Desulfovibrio sp.]
MLRLSLIINTFNRRDSLERTLESLSYLRYPNFEVVCVNGPSDDGTGELLETWRGRIKIAACPEANLSRSRNIGIQHAAGDIVCFIDDDAIPEAGWLSAIATAYDDPRVAAVGGYIRDNTGVNYQAKRLVCDRYADSYDSEAHSGDPHFYTALTGTNCSFRREALAAIGGFDEVYAYFLDETDVLLRLSDAGYEIACIEGAEVHHKYAPSSMRDEKKIAKTLYYPIRSKTYYACRHALPVHGLRATMTHLNSYIAHVAASQDWLCRTGQITKEHHASLLGDIRKGRKEGLELAFHVGAPFVKSASFFANFPTFLPFPVKKNAAERLRVCLISQDYLPKPNGGIGVWVGTLARQLAALGNEVTVITRTEGEPSIDFEENVWVHRIKQSYLPKRPYVAPEKLPQIIYDWSASAYAELLQVALMRGVDVVSAPIWDVEGIVAHCSETFPVILSLHTSYGLALPSKPQWIEMPGYLEEHVQPVIEAEKLLLQKAPLILANSHAIIEDLEQCHAMKLDTSRVTLVPHGVEDIDHSQCPTFEKKDTVTVLFVGRFEERKGIDTLLQVIPEIASARPNVRFALVGDNTIGPWWKDFSKKYAETPWFSRLYVPGFVDQEELRALYRDCDIFIAPSRYESFGLIYLEAMRWGKPCIGTHVGGIPEVVADNENGILVAPDSPQELCAALEKLIGDQRLRESMGVTSREIFLRNFTCESMALKVEKEISAFLSQRPIIKTGFEVYA